MVKQVKPLSLNDPRLDAIKKKCLPVFRINGKIKVFTWDNSPRRQLPFGTISIEQYKGKTVSEIAAEMNNLISKGGQLNIRKGTKKPEKKPEIVVDTSPKPMRWEEVPDWDKPKRVVEPLSTNELDDLLNGSGY